MPFQEMVATKLNALARHTLVLVVLIIETRGQRRHCSYYHLPQKGVRHRLLPVEGPEELQTPHSGSSGQSGPLWHQQEHQGGMCPTG